MTIHRDIKTMIDSGFIEKIFGGIRLVNQDDHVSNENDVWSVIEVLIIDYPVD